MEPRVNTAVCKYNYKECLQMCGMCPSCIFGPKPPASTRRLWKVSDEFKRRFVVTLLIRCRDVQALGSIQKLLNATSWMWFTYARSRSPTSTQEYPSLSSYQVLTGKPLGVDINEISNWFNCSPDWTKSNYLCRIFSLCDSELLRMFSNLTSVLLIRQKRKFLHFSDHNPKKHDRNSDHPALMVVPGSSKSVSGVSQYRDFIGCLPVDLSKRILGLLHERSLRSCKKVCQYWQHLAEETMQEVKFRRIFQDQIKAMMEGCSSIDIVSPTYANIVDIPVPVQDDEEKKDSAIQKVKLFEAAYAKIKTKTVQMEERNVYCGAYFSKMLLNEEDPYRVVDYKGGRLMATGSKDRLVHLLYVSSETNTVAVMRGHVGSVRAVVLCEDKSLLITAGCDATIRCWNLKTDKCDMVLYGHTSTINCLDVHDDRLVSGAKDYTVKVWCLQTWRQLRDFNFKHRSSVLSVKMDKTTIYSSCSQGLVKIWNMEIGSLLRVIDAHKNSVKCLFFNEWHLLSGDSNGKVMAWSISCDTKECLMTFNHPKEVKSLALIYLRVITGCVDGNIRIFNFITGDCLREIMVESKSGTIRSLHFHEHSILVNTTSSVQLYQFAKVFWDYADSTQGGCGDGVAQDGLDSKRSANLLTKFPHTLTSPIQKIQNCNKKPEEISMTTKSQTNGRVCSKTGKQLLMQSEKATCERIKKRGPHHPLTRDSILLRVGTIQKVKCMDEVSINMESNARLRDSWGPSTYLDLPQSDAEKQSLQTRQYPLQRTHFGHHRRPKTCIPILKQCAGQNMTNASQGREVSSASDTTRRYLPSPHSDNTRAPNNTVSRQCKSTRVKLQVPNTEYWKKDSTILPALHPSKSREDSSCSK